MQVDGSKDCASGVLIGFEFDHLRVTSVRFPCGAKREVHPHVS
jgi:hypothetical protein